MINNVKELIKQEALNLGFDAIGFTTPELDYKEYQKLEAYEQKGFCDEMPWLVEDKAKRSNPKMLWEEVKTIICLAVNIKPSAEQLENANNPNLAGIAFHAQGRDYHKVIKKRLIKLGKFIKNNFNSDFKAFVDTAPVMEKPLSEKAGLGWQGKHSLVVSRKLGVYTLLGELFVDIELPIDQPHMNHCGSCHKCVDACPTNAISLDGKVNVLKCIAFHTIENKGDIPIEIQKKMGNKIYGCDDCAKACPFNRFNDVCGNLLEPKNFNLELKTLAGFNEEQFNEFFKGTGVRRIGFLRFQRNLSIALKNQELKK